MTTPLPAGVNAASPFDRRSFLAAAASFTVFGAKTAACAPAIIDFAAQLPPALRAAVAAGRRGIDVTVYLRRLLAESPGRRIVFAPGRYGFDSGILGEEGLRLRSGTVLAGVSPDQAVFEVLGNTSHRFLVANDSSDVAVEGLGLIGSGFSRGDTDGSALLALHTAASSAAMERIRVSRCRLENFRAPYWIHIANLNPRGSAIRDIALEDIAAISRPGNSIDPADIGRHAAVIFIDGAAGPVSDIRIARFDAEASHIKCGIGLFRRVSRARLSDIRIANAGRVGARDNSGGYAILAYDSIGGMADIVIERATLSSPRSCGVYVADGRAVSVLQSRISGQTDIRSDTLPKAAIAFNGTSAPVVEGCTFADNVCDIFAFAPHSNAPFSARFVNLSSTGSSRASIICSWSGGAGQREWCDLTISGCAIESNGTGIALRNSPARYISNVLIDSCTITAPHGIDLFYDSGSPATGYVVRNCTINARKSALVARSFEGSLSIEGGQFVATGPEAAGLVLQGSPRTAVSSVRFKGYATRQLAVAADRQPAVAGIAFDR